MPNTMTETQIAGLHYGPGRDRVHALFSLERLASQTERLQAQLAKAQGALEPYRALMGQRVVPAVLDLAIDYPRRTGVIILPDLM